MDNSSLNYKRVKPSAELIDFVESYWLLENVSDQDREIVVVPDGRIDLFLSHSNTQGFHITLSGLETAPDCVRFEANTLIFAISFKLPAVEYILQQSVAAILNNIIVLPNDFWGFSHATLADFDAFCKTVNTKISALLQDRKTDKRKLDLFSLIYQHHGEKTVGELSEKVNWSERQINRYFHQQFGISLKAYSTILRFRASFSHIHEGKLFPEQNFADQAHFIKEVKRFSGVTPKELKKNSNDRFIQFSTLPGK